ncbi:MAG: ABC transporter permease, partial [Spirochaetaceae bacterium]|nr:ABC transporter permease [Spirochaetaceae bacterium]
MKLKASILFAFRMLRPRSGVRTSAGRSLLGAVFCIGLSLVPLVVVLTVSDGMIEGITERIIGLSSYHMRVSVRKGSPASESIEAMESLAQEISETEGVVSAYAERQGVALAAGSTGRVGATVRAVPSEIFAEGSDFSSLFFTEDGNLSLPTKRSALIGKKIAQSLSVKAGDSIRLVTFKTGTNGKLIPRISTFTVEGIVSCGYQELDALWIFIPFDTGYSLLSDSMSNLFVGIQTEDAFSESLIKTAYDIEKELPVGCRLYMWDELNTAQYENFASTKIMLIFVMFLIVLV